VVVSGSDWDSSERRSEIASGILDAERILGLKLESQWSTSPNSTLNPIFSEIVGDFNKVQIAQLDMLGNLERIALVFVGSKPTWKTYYKNVSTGFWGGRTSQARTYSPEWHVRKNLPPVSTTGVIFTAQVSSSVGWVIAHELVHALSGLGHTLDPR